MYCICEIRYNTISLLATEHYYHADSFSSQVTKSSHLDDAYSGNIIQWSNQNLGKF